MTAQKKPTLCLVGFASDINEIAATMDHSQTSIHLIDENATEAEIPSKADLVVYAMSEYSFSSSQLYSIFTYVNRSVDSTHQRMLFLRAARRPDGTFPSLPTFLPVELSEVSEAAARAAAS